MECVRGTGVRRRRTRARFPTLVLLAAVSMALPSLATAAAQPVRGDRLQLRDSRTLADGVPRVKRSLQYGSSDAGVTAPVAGGAGDPLLHGASLYLRNAASFGEVARIDLPASGWKPASSGYRYKSKLASSLGKARVLVDWGAARLRVRVVDRTGNVLRFSLDEAAQGILGISVESGDGAAGACSEFDGEEDGGGPVDAECGYTGRFSSTAGRAPALCPAPTTTAERDGCDRWRLLDLLVEGQMSAAGIPAVAAAIVRAGDPLWSGAWGQRHVSPSRPALASTPFMLASVSKTVTATAVLQLVEDGVFGLDDDIDTILDFPVDNPRVPGDESITVRQLLTHSSGLVDDEAVWGGYPGEPGSLYVMGDSPIALGDFLRGYFVPGGPWYDPSRNFAGYAPGGGYEYSNLATALLGYLVEAATGAALDDHSDARIFAPLAMNETGWHLADFASIDVAMPYESFGGQFSEWGQYGYPDYPDGQLRSSARDLARFLAAWAGGGILDGTRILEQATVDEALRVQAPSLDPTQGLSWYYERIGARTVVGHNGGDYGVTTDMFFDPSTGHGVLVLVNTDDTGARIRAMQRIEEALFAIAESP